MSIKHIDEIWKWVVVYTKGKRISYEGYYKVSNYGRVKSVERITRKRNRWGEEYEYPQPEKHLEFRSWDGRYPEVTLSKNNKVRLLRIHKLVLWAFVGPCPIGMWGCHKDDNKENNHIDNLYWGTPEQNFEDAFENGIRGKVSKENKLEIIRLYRESKERWGVKQELSRKFGVSQSGICYILRNETSTKLTDEQISYIYKQVGKNIRGTKVKLAKKFGVSVSTICNVSNGKSRFSDLSGIKV